MTPTPRRIRRLAPILLAATFAVLTAFALHRSPIPVHAEAAPLTWRRDIAPVLYSNCTACHHTGGSGPFDLTTYPAARRWGPQIAEVVQSRYMPPWLPEPTAGPTPVHFAGDRRLQPADIDLLTTWVKQGMPEGTQPAPTPPTYSTGWQMGPPDLILEMPAPIPVAASGADQFINFILPSTLNQTRWVRAMEIQPGAGALVHHANLILDRTASLRTQHASTWGTGIPGMDLQIDSGDAFDPDSHFLFWKPDSTALVEPPGMPWRLDPGNDLILNMHLKPTGKPEQIRARVGLYFTPTPATAHPMLLQLEHDATLDIPAGDPNFTVTDELKLPITVDLLGIYPHAHYLCREMKAWATLPNGANQPLLQIESWDIDRQSVYPLASSLTLPAGTVLHMRYLYDNSASNIHNPNSPPVRVHAGNRATDEMSHLWLQVLPHPDGSTDPRYALQQAWMENTLRKSPGDALALYNLGALNQMRGKLQAAQALYSRLLTLHPNDPRTLTSLGSALEAAGDSQAAATHFQQALALDPNNTDAAFDLATLDLRQGSNADAEQLFRSLLQHNPQDPAAADGLAEVLLNQNRSEEAQKTLKSTLLRNPSDPEAHRLLAIAYSADGDAPQTLEHLRAWAAFSPGQPDPHRALAQMLSATNRPEEALTEQHTVVQLAPDNGDDWNDLGVLEARAGHSVEARTAFGHALQLNPSHQAAQNNLRKLRATDAKR